MMTIHIPDTQFLHPSMLHINLLTIAALSFGPAYNSFQSSYLLLSRVFGLGVIGRELLLCRIDNNKRTVARRISLAPRGGGRDGGKTTDRGKLTGFSEQRYQETCHLFFFIISNRLG
jgi:hypothetical protein